ncbi:MAG TPA: type II toxin-antitoxin system RelE/ParE family toxin [Dehalococcoidia bacterium]|nr:type II toxin-antitoxin system RelE/ParE family toxin [Dehalococcoidia bacterium]
MDEYTITFSRSARRELERLDPPELNRIFPRIEALSKAPRPRGCVRLHGEDNLWRIRIGDYRIIYSIYDGERTVDIIAVRHRNEAYR